MSGKGILDAHTATQEVSQDFSEERTALQMERVTACQEVQCMV